jgi:uracil-DNA glycosylase family 4
MALINPGKRLCYPDGPLDAKIAFIGEAPGSEEEKVGRGFVGSSGHLLFRLASHAGITRDAVYCTNVVKERPVGNDISKFIEFRSNRALPTAEYTAYENALYDELKAVKANVLVPVGNIALWALCRQTAITKRRGSILSSVEGRKVIPIIHPAAALRQYILQHTIAMDLRRIKTESEFPDIRLPLRQIKLRPSFLDSMQFLDECLESPLVAYDIEVMREQVSCISFANSPYNVISIPFVSNGADYFTPDQEIDIWKKINTILSNPEIKKVGQNICFDSTFLFQRLGILTRNIEDTMIGQAICYPDFPKGLDFITSMHTREPYYKDEGKKWFKLGGSEEDFWLYNAKDSAVCFEALSGIKGDLETLKNIDAYETQCKLVEPLTYMQLRGIKVDVKGMRAEAERAGIEIERLTTKLCELSGYKLNPNSPAQLKDYFYKVKGAQPYYDRKTGAETTDKNALKRLSRKGHEEAKVLLEIRRLSKLKGTYLDVTLDDDNRLRCSFNPVGTESGRLSSSETIFGTGTNMQNLPIEFRKYLMADSDCMIYNMDLSQAENRVVAFIAPEPSMIEAFEKGVDIHRLTAGLIFGKKLDEVSDEVGSCTIGGGEFSERFWGKKANHGLNYDLGYKTFAFLYEIPEAESKFIVEQYHKAYPGVRQYHAWVRNQLAKDKTLENCFGRRRLFLDRWGDELFKSAYSFIPQSTVADKINRHGIMYIYYNQQLFRPVDIILQVHDSIVFQMNYKKYTWEEQAECILLIKQSLESPIQWHNTKFTIPVGLEVGVSMSKKDMVEVKNAECSSVAGLAGRLSSLNEQFRTSLHV